MIRTPWLGLLVVAAVGCSGDDEQTPDAAPAVDTVVFVVRHAETTTDPVDPGLSVAGQARAQALATTLSTANIAAVYSSQYRRTRETATVVADAASLMVQIRQVDGSNATTYGAELSAMVRSTNPSQAVLIVGHSNTVPDTVKALSGMTVPAIAETEYNRLYTITLAADGAHVVASTY